MVLEENKVAQADGVDTAVECLVAVDEVIPAETGLLGLLCYAGLLLGRVVAVLGSLAASGAVGTAMGPLGRPATPERANGGYRAVRLIR